jgi:hypothetical protein
VLPQFLDALLELVELLLEHADCRLGRGSGVRG